MLRRSILITLALTMVLGALPGCGRKAEKNLLGTLARERGIDPEQAKAEAARKQAAADEAKAVAEEEANKDPETFGPMVEKLRKELLYCQREHLEKFDYAQLDTGLPPVSVNAFDDDCKRPILKIYEALDERFAGKAPAVDAWLADAALLSDSLFMLSGMLKNLGSRRLSALVARMKEVQVEALALAEKVRKAELPTEESGWKAWAEDLGARHAGPDVRFEALKVAFEETLAFFEARVLTHVKKDQMVYYLAWEQRLETLRLTRQALPDAARGGELDALLAGWGRVGALMEGAFQDRKAEILDELKKLTGMTRALASAPKK